MKWSLIGLFFALTRLTKLFFQNYWLLLGKWNKTALMYAVKNGQSPVAAYLLRIGVNPCAADTSGNTPVHYAAAYGWLHCLKMLIEAGADPNAANQWKVKMIYVAKCN